MKFIVSFLVLILIHGCSCSGVYAQTYGTTADVFTGIDSPTNYVKSPWAKDNALYASANNATIVRGTTNKLYGMSSYTCDASAQNGYCEFALKPILNPDANGNCEFKGVIYGDSSLYRAQILDGSAVLKNQTAPLVFQSTTAWNEFSVNYPCQTTPKVRLTQTEAGTAPAVSLGVYYGKATNIGSGTPPDKFSAKVSSTGVLSDIKNGQYINGTTFAPTDTSLFTISLKNLSSPPNCVITLTAGADAASLHARKWTPETSTQLQVRTTYSSTASSTVNSPYPFTFSCELTGADFVQPAVTAPNWNFTGKTWTPTVSNLGAGSGTVVQATYDRDGGYSNICIAFTKDGTNGSGSTLVTYSMPPGLTIDTGRAPISQVSGGFINKGTFNAIMVADTGAPTLSFLYNGAEVTGTVMTAGTSIRGCVRVPIKENGVPWTETCNAPQLLGSVTSNAQLSLNYFSGALNATCTSSPCTTAWAAGITNVTRSGAGSYAINVPAGSCSADLSCSIHSTQPEVLWNGSNSLLQVFITRNSAGTATDSSFVFNCTCPR